MTDHPTPANTPRSPMATGTPEQKARFDAAMGPINRCSPKLDSDGVLDIAHYIITGELPTEVDQ